MTSLHTQVPDRLFQQAQALIERGWAGSMESLVAESLRRYVESHQEAMAEAFLREDVQWGLHGQD